MFIDEKKWGVLNIMLKPIMLWVFTGNYHSQYIN